MQSRRSAFRFIDNLPPDERALVNEYGYFAFTQAKMSGAVDVAAELRKHRENQQAKLLETKVRDIV